MRLLRDLWATSPRRVAAVACLIVLGAVGQASASALAGPVLVDRSAALFAVLAVALVVAVLSDLVVGLIAAGLTADWAADVRRRLCRVALGQDLPRLETTPVGELLDRIDGDVYQVASELRGSGVRIAQMLSVGLLSIVVAIGVWWPAGLVMLLLALLLALGLSAPTQRIGPARMHEEEAWSDLAAVMEESIHGQDDIRTSLARPYVLRAFAQRASEVLARARVVWGMSARVATIAVGVTRAGIAAVVLGGVWALTTDRVDGARLTAVWLLALAFGATIEHVSRMVPELQYALGAWGRVQLLRDSPQEPTGGAAPTDGDLEIRGLTFGYGSTGSDGGHRAALRDVRLSFVRGRSYALIGRTGSGKSTLAKVLTRAVDVPRGTVFLGGTDLLDLDIEGLRRWIGVVPQRTEILAGTLAENVALFDPELREQATRALHELGLTDWVADLPDGIETKLGEGGYVLSAGQEQLVAFARILVRDPHVVILDEATARMDPVTEARVQAATERLLRDRIGIVIAHRLSSVRRCDDVVVLADGEVLEAGPLRTSQRFARLLASGQAAVHAEPVRRVEHPVGVGAGIGASGVLARTDPDVDSWQLGEDLGSETVPAPTDREVADLPPIPVVRERLAAAPKADPPPLPEPAPARTLREIFRLAANDPRFGLGALLLFVFMVLLGLDGAIMPWLWADLVDGLGDPFWPAVGIVAGLLLTVPMSYYTARWFPEWWVRQMLRISLRLVHGQTGPRRVSAHTPAEVVAQGGDTERVVMLADNLLDQAACFVLLISMTVVSGTLVPALFFGGTMLVSGLAAALFGPLLERSARKTVAARAAFATALVSSLSAARTVKLAGASEPVLAHLARLDVVRSDRQRREISTMVWARSTPSMIGGLLPIAAWALYLSGSLSSGATLVAVSTLGAARWFAWTTASLVSQVPSARVWTRRTVAMTGIGVYSAPVPGVDISTGTAPAPVAPPRHPLRRLDLVGFTAVHEDGTVGVRDVDLTVETGQLVLVVGPVGAGKSSLLRALAGIVHHAGALRWNGQPVTEPEHFLRPNQVGYVAQLPRVLSGTVADNIRLGHEVDAAGAVSTAQLEHDLAAVGGGLGLLIGHKGTRLSGGQLQRLALARALAPRTELLIADDVSSALDVTTELELWRALRGHGVTVVGSTSKRAALAQADLVVVLIEGEAVAQGTWRDLEDHWGHLAG
ncbi:ABC-type multidrug transport system fused ATPase/permease subunit [Micromonospora pisi]|uniref:ABC-type multidrug transport system fused ATPase/permease subunit n=1 Tax=Micromonospora pisi TaxID=589240 RepID=A0A495JRZ6_9ACTN|nr:ABC transporter ATP-binding protein [Micromonospora pisi]RKR91134.1 ABC-type multidrug transport system fused ATPase/permease subunit [Micromonospora pisi]